MAGLPAPDRWPRIAPLLEEALDLPTERRAAFLDRACAGDSLLRAELDDLVSADSEAGAFLFAPVDLTAFVAPVEGAQSSSPDAAQGGALGAGPRVARPAGASIGPYRIVREIGRGGMGVVYEAEQQRPRRPVALKVILGGRHADAEAVRLFKRETDSLARLKHPGIAAIYESGSTDEGQHFFAMELVPGRTLSDFLEKAGPPASRRDLRRRLDLFRRIAAAVAYAHQRGVIHRDLKPSNILVLDTPAAPGARATGSHAGDEAPEIKILDFGLARITDPEGTDPDAQAATAMTAIGRIRGTLPYMSPEQIRGRRDEIDVRTDVYSLGVILYRILTGRLPHDLDGVEFPEAVRIVCEEAPRPPRAVTGARLPIDHDVTVIVSKSLEKDPARRYQSVAAFGDDIARYLSGQLILARPPSAAYQIRKLIARHKVAFAAAGAAVILITGFAGVMTLQARRIAAERDRANRESATALRVSEFMTDLFKISDPNEARGNSVKAREILDKGVEKIGKALADEPEVLARLMQIMGKVYTNLGLYDQAGPILEQSLAIRRRALGEDHPDTLAVMSDMARIHTYMGRAAKAEEIHARLIEIRRRVLGEDHPETLGSMSGLAYAYRHQGRYKESETLVRRVLEARRRILGDDHPDTIASMVSLADGYRMEHRYADAEAAYLPAIEALRRVRGHDHPATLENIGYLAIVYRSQGRYAEAETLAREALDGLRRVEGEDHPVTLETMHQLASIYGSAGRYTEGERLLRDVLQARRRVLGEDHFATLNSMNNLAYILALQQRYGEAEVMLREAVEKMRRLQGEKHPDTLNSIFNLGCLAALQGDRAEALAWLGLAVENGWSRVDRLTKDDDLKSLRGDPAFEALIAQVRKSAGP